MYQNIVMTVAAAVLIVWFLYDILGRFFHKPGKMISALSGHSMDFYDVYGQLQAEFKQGSFEKVITLTETLLTERPLEDSALSYKAYALFHLKKYEQAREIFLLLDTLPNSDASKMLKKIDEILTA